MEILWVPMFSFFCVFFFVGGVGVLLVFFFLNLRAATVGLCCFVALRLEALGFWGSGFKEA